MTVASITGINRIRIRHHGAVVSWKVGVDQLERSPDSLHWGWRSQSPPAHQMRGVALRV